MSYTLKNLDKKGEEQYIFEVFGISEEKSNFMQELITKMLKSDEVKTDIEILREIAKNCENAEELVYFSYLYGDITGVEEQKMKMMQSIREAASNLFGEIGGYSDIHSTDPSMYVEEISDEIPTPPTEQPNPIM